MALSPVRMQVCHPLSVPAPTASHLPVNLSFRSGCVQRDCYGPAPEPAGKGELAGMLIPTSYVSPSPDGKARVCEPAQPAPIAQAPRAARTSCSCAWFGSVLDFCCNCCYLGSCCSCSCDCCASLAHFCCNCCYIDVACGFVCSKLGGCLTYCCNCCCLGQVCGCQPGLGQPGQYPPNPPGSMQANPRPANQPGTPNRLPVVFVGNGHMGGEGGGCVTGGAGSGGGDGGGSVS